MNQVLNDSPLPGQPVPAALLFRLPPPGKCWLGDFPMDIMPERPADLVKAFSKVLQPGLCVKSLDSADLWEVVERSQDYALCVSLLKHTVEIRRIVLADLALEGFEGSIGKELAAMVESRAQSIRLTFAV